VEAAGAGSEALQRDDVGVLIRLADGDQVVPPDLEAEGVLEVDLAVAHPEWRVLANAQVVKVKVGRDHASATLRLGDCTMPNTQASFERDEDGSWRQVFHSFGDEAYPLLCEEDYPGYD
jgi:hypothetical protein